MDSIISLNRFSSLRDSPLLSIDWHVTLSCFALLAHGDHSTDFISNEYIIFASKLLLIELPFHDRLMATRPDFIPLTGPALCAVNPLLILGLIFGNVPS